MSLHLDANALIAILGGDSNTLALVKRRVANGEPVSASALAWFEFLCGPPKSPVTEDEIDFVQAFVEGRIVSTDGSVALLAARLFIVTGRTEGSQAGCLVAAMAILHNAELFTLNTADFKPFEPFGLRLAR